MPSRPFVTLSYAQSLDGCIAGPSRYRLMLSCPESLELTHTLRASSDAVLVGIGTVLADDPRLSVRYAPGKDPRPIVLDSLLRMPENSNLLKDSSRQPLIVTTEAATKKQQKNLERLGAQVMRLPADAQGLVDLTLLLPELLRTGINTLMVEGGARVIKSFMETKLADRLMLTVAPMLVGGLPGVERNNGSPLPRLVNVSRRMLGEDIILQADLRWEER